MDVGILGRLEVAAEEERFDALEKARVGRQNVLELAVRRARLSHQHLSVFLDYLCLDLARM